MIFFTGMHQPSDASRVDRAFISVNRLRNRKSDFAVNDWIMDSGAFTEISKHGRYTRSVEDYAAQIRRWSSCGNLLAAVSHDWMCEPWIIERTGLSVKEHQGRTIARYMELAQCDTAGVYIMPVLQGYEPIDYARHLDYYRDLLEWRSWVGVGSVCKRNGDPKSIIAVLSTIKKYRPDLRLHGFGLKTTALRSALIQDLLYSADSMAWSFAARKQGRDANSWREAKLFADSVMAVRNPTQMEILI